MISIESHGDVTRITMSSPTSRAIGYSVSAYVVRGVLIDTGFPSVRAQLARAVAELRPRGALITHYHEDHGGNVGLLVRRGTPVGLSEATTAALRTGKRIGLYRQIIWGQIEPLPPLVVPFADEALSLVSTPGHSPDHHIVWDAERETIFGGDLFLGVKVRVAHAGENPRRLAESVRAALALAPRRFFDAHRGPIDDPRSALRAKADWMDETIDRIDRRIADGAPDRAIAREVLGREGAEYFVSNGGLSKLNFVRALRKKEQ